MRRRLALAILLALCGQARAEPKPITIFAAASLTDALKDIATLWQAAGHPRPVISLGASSTLARQIEQGAPADIFISADGFWMDDAAAKGVVLADTRFDLAGNTLVLAEQKAKLKPITLQKGADLAGVLGHDGRLGIADPTHVPAGLYARAALTKLGLWESVAQRLAPAEDVRAALALLIRGEVPAAIVYGSDIHTRGDLAAAGIFPEDSHDPIRYPACLTKAASPEALPFLAFLKTTDAQVVLRHYGFSQP